ncbi:MAG: CDP-alcohol phosphatidyltransferase [Actinomycetia bacterium]|nr:CDP-alcohol phosphatidyltransferase [Actinomycetes bacterium]
MATYSLEDVRRVCKKRDAWWTMLVVDPLAVRLTRFLANWTSITPNQISLASFAMGLVAAGCFATATPHWLALGALAYHIGFILNCCDGKIARLKGTGTRFGPWLHYIFDRVGMLCCTLTLVGGQYVRTGRAEFFYVGFAVLSLDMFRHLNTLHVAKIRQAMCDSLGTAGLPAEHVGVVSGVEFQMALFIAAPLTGMITPITLVAGGMLVASELVIIYRLWLSTRECAGLIEGFTEGRRFGSDDSEAGSAVTERPLSGAGVR